MDIFYPLCPARVGLLLLWFRLKKKTKPQTVIKSAIVLFFFRQKSAGETIYRAIANMFARH